MTFWSNDSSKVRYAQEYFSSFSSMAARIIEKQTLIINQYPADKWENFSVEEKEEVLDQHFILPELVSKYKSSSTSSLPTHYQSVFPKLVVNTGQAYHTTHNEDDTSQVTWQDEHSGPFSWETKSQMKIPLPPPTDKSKSRKSSKRRKVDSKKKKKRFEESSNKTANEASEFLTKPLKLIDANSHKANSGATFEFSSNSLTSTQPNPFPKTFDLQSNVESSKRANYGKPSLPADDVKVELTYVKPTVHKEPLVRQEQPNSFSVPDKETKMRPSSKKSKSSSRVNPRSSLTLDGAIRNLEIAMQEERTAQDVPSDVKQVQHSSNFQFDEPKVEDKQESPTLRNDDSPLLNDQSPTLSLSLEDFELELDSPEKKSGFDFLDNCSSTDSGNKTTTGRM